MLSKANKQMRTQTVILVERFPPLIQTLPMYHISNPSIRQVCQTGRGKYRPPLHLHWISLSQSELDLMAPTVIPEDKLSTTVSRRQKSLNRNGRLCITDTTLLLKRADIAPLFRTKLLTLELFPFSQATSLKHKRSG